MGEHKTIVCRIFEGGLDHGEVEAITALTHPEFIDHNIHVETGIPGGAEEIREALIAIRQSFPNTQVTIEDVIAEGPVAERWAVIDTLTLLQQLGVIPVPI